MSKVDGGDISEPGSATTAITCGFCHKSFKGKKSRKFFTTTCFQEYQKANSKQSTNAASFLSLANSDQDVYSTPKKVSKPKRLLSADSSPDLSMSDSKKICYAASPTTPRAFSP
jgi:hypothetical protein